jgi:hypothetical protein
VNEHAHIKTTRLAIKIANRVFDLGISLEDEKLLAASSADTDHLRDVEFIAVKGARDDPHRWEWFQRNDQAHFASGDVNLTAFNHYIDIKKGPGIFDDYDGYSYALGSAHKEQYQKAKQITRQAVLLLAELLNCKVDEGISFWLNDEYVHVPGEEWYRGCSPALLHYSYPQDLGKYQNQTAELQARFPLAMTIGRPGCGFPYSVFMPVDNLGRYWFDLYARSENKDLNHLGPLLHAIQDASIPHHAAGYVGNWHVEYEFALDDYIKQAYPTERFSRRVTALLKTWKHNSSPAPRGKLYPRHREKTPSAQWSIQHLITWMALHAYTAYAETYHQFQAGFKINRQSLEKLCSLATASSALALYKAVNDRKRQL